MSRTVGVALIVVAVILGFLGSKFLSRRPAEGTIASGTAAPETKGTREQGPEQTSDGEIRSPIELKSTTATRDIPDGPDASAPVHAPKRETREDETRRFLTTALRELETATPQEQFWCAQRVLITSIAAIMDAAGTSTPTPQGPHVLEETKGSFTFLYNQRTYKFREGAFPEYDDFMKVWDHRENTGPRSIADMDPAGTWNSGARELQLDPQTIQQIKIRAAEAAAVLGPGR